MPLSLSDSSSDKEASEGELPELVKFREEWRAELQRRKAGHADIRIDPSNSNNAKTNSEAASQIIALQVTQGSSNRPSTRQFFHNKNKLRTPRHTQALDLYRSAIYHEQGGELDQALLLYRKAFRLVENVDEIFQSEQILESISKEKQEFAREKLPASPTPNIDGSEIYQPNASNTGSEIFASLLKFSADIKFDPENENEPVLLNEIPEEIMILILSKLDATSVERFAKVSKKARILTLDSVLWKELVRKTYQPPQVPGFDYILSVVIKHAFDFRTLYIEHPRVRLDGVYISTCHYVRPGLSDNHWININHLITYHRYLRFFQSGEVLSLLVNEEYSPQKIIPILKPDLRMKGLFIGQWRLLGNAVHLDNLADASGRFVVPDKVPEMVNRSPEENPRYMFFMTLNLRSRPIGRWNRMDIQSYDSQNIETGDLYPVVLKHEKSFWFSKVRSYGG